MRVENTHRCCAERVLLEMVVAEAHRHGVAPHKLAAWVHRKERKGVKIARPLASGNVAMGCCIPCMLCRRELIRYGLRIECYLDDGRAWTGRMSDSHAPQSCLTSIQKKFINNGLFIRK